MLSPQEVAARYGTQVEWTSIVNSKGLTGEQVRAAHAAGHVTRMRRRR
jgi:hypothetical protein